MLAVLTQVSDGHDDLIARTDAHRMQHEMQSDGGRTDRDRMRTAEPVAEHALELQHARAAGDPARAQTRYDFFDVAFINTGPRKCEKGGTLRSKLRCFPVHSTAPPGAR